MLTKRLLTSHTSAESVHLKHIYLLISLLQKFNTILQTELNMCIFMFNFHYWYQISKALYRIM